MVILSYCTVSPSGQLVSTLTPLNSILYIAHNDKPKTPQRLPTATRKESQTPYHNEESLPDAALAYLSVLILYHLFFLFVGT